MVLPKPAMYTGGNKPKLRAVMLQNVAGLHYICITAQKPPANIDSLSVPALTGKYDFYFTVGFPVYRHTTSFSRVFNQVIISFSNFI